MRPNIGLIGKMGAGKTTAADYLINTHGYVPVSFAAPLKQMVIEADPLICLSAAGTQFHLADILDAGISFEEAKRRFPEVRRSLQRIGQGVRKLDPDYWVRHALKQIAELDYQCAPVVVTDVRYLNEAVALEARGFTMTRITRKPSARGMTTEETHAALHDSETALDGYAADVTISNDGDLRDLADALEALTARGAH